MPAAQVPVARAGLAFKGTVLGVDPSLRASGLAVIRTAGGGVFELLEQTTVVCPKSMDLPESLARIHGVIDEILGRFVVDALAIEQTIYVQNYRTAQTLGAVRGVAITPAALRGIPVHEYAPLRIKQAVVGHGKASKEQVQGMVKKLTSTEQTLTLDESDAAAAAICHALTYKVTN